MRITIGIERLSLCPHQYELIEGAEGSGSRLTYPGSAYLGSCIHRALELYFQARLADENPDLVWLLSQFDEAWTGGHPLPDGMTLHSIQWHQDDTEESARLDGIGMLTAYFPTAEKLEPLHVEHHWQAPYGSELLEGHIDLITVDKTIIDFKTSKRRKAQIEVDTSIQLSMYAWAMRETGVWGRRDDKVAIHCITRGKRLYKRGKKLVPNPEPYKVAVIPSRRNLINYEWIDETFLPRLVEMKTSGAFPASPGTHCAICPAREYCGHWESIMQGRDDIALAVEDD